MPDGIDVQGDVGEVTVTRDHDDTWCSPDTTLTGDGACLDSMGFVNFVVTLEDELDSLFGITIDLAEKLESTVSSPKAQLTVSELYQILVGVVTESEEARD